MYGCTVCRCYHNEYVHLALLFFLAVLKIFKKKQLRYGHIITMKFHIVNTIVKSTESYDTVVMFSKDFQIVMWVEKPPLYNKEVSCY